MNGTNKKKRGKRGRTPATKKFLGQYIAIHIILHAICIITQHACWATITTYLKWSRYVGLYVFCDIYETTYICGLSMLWYILGGYGKYWAVTVHGLPISNVTWPSNIKRDKNCHILFVVLCMRLPVHMGFRDVMWYIWRYQKEWVVTVLGFQDT